MSPRFPCNSSFTRPWQWTWLPACAQWNQCQGHYCYFYIIFWKKVLRNFKWYFKVVVHGKLGRDNRDRSKGQTTFQTFLSLRQLSHDRRSWPLNWRPPEPSRRWKFICIKWQEKLHYSAWWPRIGRVDNCGTKLCGGRSRAQIIANEPLGPFRDTLLWTVLCGCSAVSQSSLNGFAVGLLWFCYRLVPFCR